MGSIGILTAAGVRGTPFEARPSVVPQIRRHVRAFGERARLSEGRTEELVLAVSEVAANVVRHSGSGWVRVDVRTDPGCVEVILCDGGMFRPGVPVPGPEGGFGLPLVLALVDQVTIRGGTERDPGTVVRLIKRRSR